MITQSLLIAQLPRTYPHHLPHTLLSFHGQKLCRLRLGQPDLMISTAFKATLRLVEITKDDDADPYWPYSTKRCSSTKCSQPRKSVFVAWLPLCMQALQFVCRSSTDTLCVHQNEQRSKKSSKQAKEQNHVANRSNTKQQLTTQTNTAQTRVTHIERNQHNHENNKQASSLHTHKGQDGTNTWMMDWPANRSMTATNKWMDKSVHQGINGAMNPIVLWRIYRSNQQTKGTRTKQRKTKGAHPKKDATS